MNDNVLIPLSGFGLPGDFPWRVGFVAHVDEQLRRLRATGHFLPPRFFGYYFCGDQPFAVGGAWTVSLDIGLPMSLLPEAVLKFTNGQYPTQEDLVAHWEQGWAALFFALEPLGSGDLERCVKIRGEPLTVLQAINRQLTHYAYHVGQIVFLAKHLAGPRWKTLSIAVGESAKFNQAPARYVG